MLTKTQWYHVLFLAIAIAVLTTLLYLVRGILPPFVIAFVIAWLLDPLLGRLQKRGCPRILAVSAVYIVFLAAFVLGLVFLVPPVIDQAKQLGQDLPGYAERFGAFAADLMEKHRATLAKFELPTTLQEAFAKYGEQAKQEVINGITYTSRWIVSSLSKALWLVLIPLVAFYFLNDIDRIRKKTALLIPQQWRARTTEVLSRMGLVFSSYVRGLIVVCLLFGVVTTIVLVISGLKYGIILGLLSAVLYAVPYLGAILITLLVFLVALATHGLGYAIWMAVLMVALNQFLFDMLITPKILGKSVGLHPVLSLFALMAGGSLFGLVGMVLAVPVAASIQEIVFEFRPDLRAPGEPKRGKRRSSSGGDKRRVKGK
ncbi:MAG TPA: AI-2E family transporter [Armatimonadota bacterium]|nr:AI-2E family transporter [Armatimonadota bacterium]